MRFFCLFFCLLAYCLTFTAAAQSGNAMQDSVAFHSIFDTYKKVLFSRPDSALAIIHRAMAVAEARNYTLGKHKAYQAQAVVYGFIFQQPAKALRYTDTAEVLLRTLHRPRLMVPVLMTRAEAHRLLNRAELALNENYQALKIAETPPADSVMIIKIYANIGTIYSNLNQEEARRAYHKVLVMATRQRQMPEVGRALSNLAAVMVDANQNDSAVVYLTKAIGVYKSLNDLSNIGVSKLALGMAHRKLEQYEAAKAHLEEALAIFQQMKNDDLMANTSSQLALLYTKQGKYAQAVPYTEQAIAHLDSTKWIRARDVYFFAATLYRSMGNYQKADSYMLKSLRATDSLHSTEQRRQVAIERENYEVNKRDAQIASLATAQEKATIRQNIGLGIVVLLLVVVGFTLYIAQRRRTYNRKLATLNTELTAANTIKDRVMSILSHDLRAPLSSLNSFLQLTRLMDLPAEQRARAERQLTNQLSATLELLNNLLQWSRNEVKGEQPVHPTTTSVAELVETAIEPLRSIAEGKNIRIEQHLPSQFAVYADTTMATFVLRNLFSNALKFSPSGGCIYFSAQKRPNEAVVEISVRDEGAGIEPARIPTLFSLKENTSTVGTDAEMGTGIGLPMAADLAHRTGGDLRVESQLGSGTTFTFSLPMPI